MGVAATTCRRRPERCAINTGGGANGTQEVRLKIKSVGDEGSFTGLGAAYNNVDLGGDQIVPGAFSRTLAAGKQYPVLWQHDAASPIGTCKVTDSAQGLVVDGTLLLEDPTARKAHLFLKAGVISGLSIGFETLQSQMSGDVRELTELRLWEMSIVTFPMNESAQIQSVKSLSVSDDEVQHRLREIRRHQKAMRCTSSAFSAMTSTTTLRTILLSWRATTQRRTTR